jgi:hypothetical protein
MAEAGRRPSAHDGRSPARPAAVAGARRKTAAISKSRPARAHEGAARGSQPISLKWLASAAANDAPPMSDIAAYETETFQQLGPIEMPGGADQALASRRLIQR